jgi:nucleoid DNA-binding protein
VDELIKLVTQKAGISEAQAQQAVETVMGFLKDKLPEPIASQVEGMLSGGEMPDLGDLGKTLGGLLGK